MGVIGCFLALGFAFIELPQPWLMRLMLSAAMLVLSAKCFYAAGRISSLGEQKSEPK